MKIRSLRARKVTFFKDIHRKNNHQCYQISNTIEDCNLPLFCRQLKTTATYLTTHVDYIENQTNDGTFFIAITSFEAAAVSGSHKMRRKKRRADWKHKA